MELSLNRKHTAPSRNFAAAHALAVVVSLTSALAFTGSPAEGGPVDAGPLWVARGGSPAGPDDAWDVDVDPGGNRIYVTGESSPDGDTSDYFTLAYDAPTGAMIWSARYDPGLRGDGEDSAYGLAVAPDGSQIFVTGESTREQIGFGTVAYDSATGDREWVAHYDPPADYFFGGRDIGVSPDGSRVYVTGSGPAPGGKQGAGYVTLAYEAATGRPLWEAFLRSPEIQSSSAYDLAVAADGSRVYVTGHALFAGIDWDIVTVVYDAATGQQTGIARWGGPSMSQDTPADIETSSDTSLVFVTGTRGGVGFITIAYGADLSEQHWTAKYRGPIGWVDSAVAVAVSPDGRRVGVTGPSSGPPTGYTDFATIVYDAASGRRVWIARYSTEGSDSSSDLVFGADGRRLFVTGEGQGLGQYGDYATVAYDGATGEQLGVTHYSSPGDQDDTPRAIAMSPIDDGLFVTGSSGGENEFSDYATVAYDIG